MTGSLVGSIDVAQMVLYAFWVFFAGLVWYLRQEDRREGYPLEEDVTGRYNKNPFLFIPPKKTFVLPHGHGTVDAPNFKRDERPLSARRIAPAPGYPIEPVGNPLLAGVGPGSWAERAERPGARPVGRLRGEVTFENVDFRFPDSGAGVNDVSFRVEAGQTVAIVGPTGAGKTTLVNLLQRVFDPDSGAIRIDGIDIATVTRDSLRAQIATVFQDSGLLNRSIEENIRLGRDDATYDEVHEAAMAAAAQDFILAKSEGYDTVAGERGGQLSGGERQRIAIARAVLKDAPILVLDEATSALDVETEAKVKAAIDRLRAGRTTFVIAHRLSTVCDADLVIFMDKGRIVEIGGYHELAARDQGRFAALLRAGGLLDGADRLHTVPMDVAAERPPEAA